MLIVSRPSSGASEEIFFSCYAARIVASVVELPSVWCALKSVIRKYIPSSGNAPFITFISVNSVYTYVRLHTSCEMALNLLTLNAPRSFRAFDPGARSAASTAGRCAR